MELALINRTKRPVPLPEGHKGLKLTKFDFEHKVFTIPGAYIASAKDGTPLLHVALGDINAAMTVKSVKHEFGIDSDSKDSQLLDMAEKALFYVRYIAPGDAVPTEIIDGTASWSIDDEHYHTAHNKLLLKLASWAAGRDVTANARDALERALKRPEVQQQVNRGIDEAAVALKVKDRDEVVRMIDTVGREMAYIEALREYFGWVLNITNDIKVLQSTLKNDKQYMESTIRASDLIARPIAGYKKIFTNVDAQVSEITNALRNLPAAISFIRETRDDLHAHSMVWKEIEELWKEADPTSRDSARASIQRLYSFLAQNFLHLGP